MPPDRELVKRIAQHDARAFDVLFDRYHETVRGRIARIVRDPDAAEDVAQEVFLRVWTRAGQWGGRGAVRAWLLRIATNLALNHLRSRRRSRVRPLAVPPDPGTQHDAGLVPAWMADPDAPGPDALADLSECWERMSELIGRLPDEKRRVYEMVHEQDMEIRAVAEELGIPMGTVRSRLHYTRKMLRRGWEELTQHEENE